MWYHKVNIYRILTDDKTKWEGAVNNQAFKKIAELVINSISAIGAFAATVRNKTVRLFDSSVVAHHMKKFRENIPYIKNSIIGTFMLTFGIYSTLISVFRFSFLSEGTFADIFISLCVALLSLPFLFSRGTPGTILALSETGSIIAKVMGVRIHINHSRTTWGRANIAFLLGVLLGSATFVFAPLSVVFFILFVVAAGFVLTYPESAVLFITVLLPLGNGELLSFVSVFGIVAFLIKALRGKRSITYHHHRAAALILMVMVFVSEIHSGSLKFSLMMLAFFLLCASDGNGERAENIISVAVVVFGTVSAFYMAFVCMSVFGETGADLSIFNIPALALCCAALIPLSASFMLSKTGLPRQTTFLCTVAMLGLLLYNGYFMYTIASAASIVILLFFFRRRAAYAFFSAVCAFYAVWVWMGGGSNRVAVTHLLNFLKEIGIAYDEGVMYILVGGIMEDNFAPSESFYGAILTSLGILGAVALAGVLCLLFGYILRKKYGKGSDRSTATYMRAWAPASSVVVMLICGLGTNIWAYDEVFALFWILMGAASAIAADAENKARRSVMAQMISPDRTKAEITL